MERRTALMLAALVGPLLAGCRPIHVGINPSSAPTRVDPHGKRIVRVENERLEMWDLGESGFTPLEGPSGSFQRYVQAWGLEPGGDRIVLLTSRGDAPFRWWCTLDERPLGERGIRRRRFIHACRGVTYSADGSALAAYGHDLVFVRRKGAPAVRHHFDQGVTAVALSADASHIAIALEGDGADAPARIEIRRLGKRRPTRVLEGHDAYAHVLLFLPDGRLVSGGRPALHEDGPTAHVWSLEGVPTPLPGLAAGSPITTLAVSADGRELLAGGWTHCGWALMSWSLEGPLEATHDTAPKTPLLAAPTWVVAMLDAGPDTVFSVAFDANGHRVAVGHEVVWWDADVGVLDTLFAKPPQLLRLCG